MHGNEVTPEPCTADSEVYFLRDVIKPLTHTFTVQGAGRDERNLRAEK